MGHSVSTPRVRPARENGYNFATTASLSMLLAVATTTNASSGTSSCRGCNCFVTQPHHSQWLVSPAITTGDAVATAAVQLRATSAGLAVATVPPPNSRLGRWRQQSTQASSLQRLEPPGTKRSQRAGHAAGKAKHGGSKHHGHGNRWGSTGLRYATHCGSHYAQYCSNGNAEHMSGDESSWKDVLSYKAHAVEDMNKGGDDNLLSLTAEEAALNNLKISSMDKPAGNQTQNVETETNINSRARSLKLKRGKRARMLRFLDKRLARLQFKSEHKIAGHRVSSTSNVGSIDNQRRLDYEKRKAAWAAKYTSVSTLRKSFGTNKNRIWGDFDPTTTRRLYHTLLPRALLELRGLRDGLLASNTNNGSDKDENATKQVREKRGQRRKVQQDNASYNTLDQNDDMMTDLSSETYLQNELKELAPLAYQARLAAKKYARERSRLPGRIGSMLYDGFRSWRRYGKFKSSGMTWEQVWAKYEDQVLREAMEELDNVEEEASALFGTGKGGLSRENLNDEELTARICLRILERSVVTNDAIDKLFLERLADNSDLDTTEDVLANDAVSRKQRRQERQRQRKLRIQADLRSIEKKFDDDIRELLKYGNLASKEGEERRSRRKGGVFFWKKSSAADGTLTEDGQDSTSVDTAAAFARGESDTTLADTATTSSSSRSTEPSDTTPTEELAAAMFSMNEGQATSTASDEDYSPSKLRTLAVHEVFALRILATTKQRITSLQALGGSDANTNENATPLNFKDEGDRTNKKDGQ